MKICPMAYNIYQRRFQILPILPSKIAQNFEDFAKSGPTETCTLHLSWLICLDIQGEVFTSKATSERLSIGAQTLGFF